LAPKLKSRIAIGALVLGTLAFAEAASVLCYCPVSFILPAALSTLAVWLGSRRIRIASILLFVACAGMGIHDYRAEKHIEAIFRAVQEKQGVNTNVVN
jgi:hypothetical protein